MPPASWGPLVAVWVQSWIPTHTAVILSRSHVVTRAESWVRTQTTSGLWLEFVVKKRAVEPSISTPGLVFKPVWTCCDLYGCGVSTHALGRPWWEGWEQGVHKHLMKTMFPHP